MNHGEALNGAADIIEAQGFAQADGTQVGTGPKCALGAIAQAVGHTETYNGGGDYNVYTKAPPAAFAFARYLDPHTRSTTAAWTYNDTHTAEDVVAQLRAAALIEEAKALEALGSVEA